MRILLGFLMVALVACNGTEGKSTTDDPAGAASPAEVSTPAGGHPRDVEGLRASVAATMALPEKDVKKIEVAHVLIAFKGSERSKATRSQDEAEALTAELFGRALDGEDFTALVNEYSDDRPAPGAPGGGPYTMSTDGSGGFPRAGMAKSFGDVGWRLEVGQVAVAGYDRQKSGFGWHIIKRLQ